MAKKIREDVCVAKVSRQSQGERGKGSGEEGGYHGGVVHCCGGKPEYKPAVVLPFKPFGF